ncbi:hypothetical protein Vretifemale_19145, partial [Volvox reticuliferus]
TGRREPHSGDLLEPSSTERSAGAPSVIAAPSTAAATESGGREGREEEDEEGIQPNSTSSVAAGVEIAVPSCDALQYGMHDGANSVGGEPEQLDTNEYTPVPDQQIDHCKTPAADELPGCSSEDPETLPAAKRVGTTVADRDAMDTLEYDPASGLPTQPRFGIAVATTTTAEVTDTGEPAACGNGEGGGDAAKPFSPPPPPPTPKPRRAAALRAQAALAATADDDSEGGRVSKRSRALGSSGLTGGGTPLRADGGRTRVEHGDGGKGVTLDVDREGHIHVTLPTHVVRELLQDRTPLLDTGRRDAALHRSTTGLATCNGGSWLGCQIHRGCRLKRSLFNHHLDRSHPHNEHSHHPHLLHLHRHQRYRQIHRGRGAARAVGGWVLMDQPLDVAAGPSSIPGPALAPVLQHLFRYLAGRTGDSYCEQLPGREHEQAQRHKTKVQGENGVAGPSSPAPTSSGIKRTRASGSSSSNEADGPAVGQECAEAAAAGVTTGGCLGSVHPVSCRTSIHASESLMPADTVTATANSSGAADCGLSPLAASGGGGGVTASVSAAGTGNAALGYDIQDIDDRAQIVDLADCDEAGPSEPTSVGIEGHGQQQQQQRQQQPAGKGNRVEYLQAGEGGDEEENDSQEDEDTRLLVEDAGALSGMPLCTNNEVGAMDREEVEQLPDGSKADPRWQMAADGFTARTQAMLQTLQAMVAGAYSERTLRDANRKSAKRRRLDAEVAAVPGDDGNVLQVTTAAELLRTVAPVVHPAAAMACRQTTATPSDAPNRDISGAIDSRSGGDGTGVATSYSRMAAARTFYDLLVLSNRGYISLRTTSAAMDAITSADTASPSTSEGGADGDCIGPEQLVVVARPRLLARG